VLQRHYTFRYRFKMKHFVRLDQAVLDTYQNTQCLPQVIIHKYPLYIYFWNYIKVLQPSPSPSTNKPTLSIFPHTTCTYHLHFRIPAAITSRDVFYISTNAQTQFRVYTIDIQGTVLPTSEISHSYSQAHHNQR
jgi:hypothetical protein